MDTNIKFKMPLLAVKNIDTSVKFYMDLFEQKITFDFGKNKVLSGGFALQENFDWLVNIPRESIKSKSHNMELYFKVENFDSFLEKLNQYKIIEFVNKPIKHEWQQRVVHIYDPDYHIIEIGESMEVIIKRLLNEGKTVEQTAKLTQHPVNFIKNLI